MGLGAYQNAIEGTIRNVQIEGAADTPRSLTTVAGRTSMLDLMIDSGHPTPAVCTTISSPSRNRLR